jgi:peroxiredoxin
MSRPIDFPLPANLPRPVDDGAGRHLTGMPMPAVALHSTRDRMIDLSQRTTTRVVVYCYPMTGVPGTALPEGWDEIPGARGCTPQTWAFRESHAQFADIHTEVFGLSTQTTAYQREMADRLNLPFEILSDERYTLCDALRLPTFTIEGRRLLKRLTLIIRDHRIEHVFYPVFPPDTSAAQVFNWLLQNPLHPKK